MLGDVEVNLDAYQARAVGVPQTRFQDEVYSAAVSKDAGGTMGKVEDGSRGFAGDQGSSHERYLSYDQE